MNETNETLLPPKVPLVTAPDFTREEFDKAKEDATRGNFPALLMLVLHNQLVMNETLKKLLKYHERD